MDHKIRTVLLTHRSNEHSPTPDFLAANGVPEDALIPTIIDVEDALTECGKWEKIDPKNYPDAHYYELK